MIRVWVSLLIFCCATALGQERSDILASNSPTLFLDRPDCLALSREEVLEELSDLRSIPFTRDDLGALDARFGEHGPGPAGPAGPIPPKLQRSIHAVLIAARARSLGLDERDVKAALQAIAVKYSDIPHKIGRMIAYRFLSRAALYSLRVLGVPDEYFADLIREHEAHPELASLSIEVLSALSAAHGLEVLELLSQELKGQSSNLDIELGYWLMRGVQVQRFLDAWREADRVEDKLELALRHYHVPSRYYGTTISFNFDWRPFAARRAIIALSEEEPLAVARYVNGLEAREVGLTKSKIRSVESCVSQSCLAALEELR